MTINFKETTTRDFLRKLFTSINVFLGNDYLTSTEIVILTEFYLLDKDRFKYQRFSSLGKKYVLEALKEQGFKFTKANLNNKIARFVNKGVLKRDDDRVISFSKAFENIYNELVQNSFSTAKILVSLSNEEHFNTRAIPKGSEDSQPTRKGRGKNS